MAFMRSQLSLVMLLTVICAVAAKSWSVEEWQDFLKDKKEYKNWCNKSNTEKCFSTDGKMNFSDGSCVDLYLALKVEMDRQNWELQLRQHVAAILLENNAKLCSTIADTTRISSTSFIFPSVDKHDSSNSTDSTTKDLESRGPNYFCYILTVLALVVIAMLMGCIYIYRYTIISGCRNYSKPGEKSAIQLESHII